MRSMRLVHLSVIVGAVVGCGAEASGTPETSGTPRASESEPQRASASAAPPRQAATEMCIPTPESGALIAEGLTVQGGGTLRDAYAVPLAPGLNFGFVVAAEIDGPGMEGDGEIGTWAVGELGGGPIFAVNTMAQEFSEWGAAASEGSPADVARDAVAANDASWLVLECIGGS